MCSLLLKMRIILIAIILALIASPCLHAQQRETFPPSTTLSNVEALITAYKQPHPRLMTNAEELSQLADIAKTDPTKQLIAEEIIRKANLTLDQPPVERKLVGIRLLSTSRLCVERVLTLSLAYHLTGDERYAKRCEAEMLAAASFSDWNPAHFLDVAEMTLALSIGYDWLYDQLDPKSREQIRDAIVAKGLELQFSSRNRGWIHKANNWGQVCHAGMVAGALAVIDDERELAARTIHSAIQNVVPAMEQYSPNGSYPEGPHYWSYGTSFNVILLDALEHAFGTDFGLAAAPGFSETGSFVSQVCGPSGDYFNYSDGGADREPQVSLPWLAERFNHPEWLAGEHERWQSVLGPNGKVRPEAIRHFSLYLLWAPTTKPDSSISRSTGLPLHWLSDGPMPIAVHRSAWNDPRAFFIAIKAGTPSASHGHMDAGSFVLESDGVRWGIDLGREDYHAIETLGLVAWKFDQKSDRWKIFKYNNHGHNTLVIDGHLQHAAGTATILDFSDNPTRPYTIIDLTDVYQGQASSTQRGVSLLPTGQFVIRDELTGLKPGSEVRWAMLTLASAEITDNSATLSQKGETLQLLATTPANVDWKTVDVSHLPNEWDSPNHGTQMLTLTAVAPESGDLTINVVTIPGSNKNEPSEFLDEPLEHWGDAKK
jgi:hypothetical protein